MLCLFSYQLLAFHNIGRNMDAGIFSCVSKDTKKVNLYFISGLGVDERAFQKLKLSPNFTVHYLRWIKPLKNETITSYAKRLAIEIDQSRPFCTNWIIIWWHDSNKYEPVFKT